MAEQHNQETDIIAKAPFLYKLTFGFSTTQINESPGSGRIHSNKRIAGTNVS